MGIKGGYQLLNLPIIIYIYIYIIYLFIIIILNYTSLVLVLDPYFHTSQVLVLGFKADFLAGMK